MTLETSPCAQLSLYVHGAASDWRASSELQDLPFADASDMSCRQLLRANPAEFFALYAAGRIVVNAHAAKGLAEAALNYAARRPTAKLVLAGRWCRRVLIRLQDRARELGVQMSVQYIASPGLFKAVEENAALSFVPSAGFASDADAFAACLAPFQGVRGALYWTNLWKTQVENAALETGIRKHEAFYSFAKNLARCTGPVNFSELGRSVGLPGVTVRQWAAFLEILTLISVTPALNLKPQRRTLDRVRVRWLEPGLRLWLSGALFDTPAALKRSLLEDALFDALYTRRREDRIFHFADTNHVTSPLVVERGETCEAYYLYADDQERKICLRHHKSLAKTGRFAPEARLIADRGFAQTLAVELVDPGAGLTNNTCN